MLFIVVVFIAVLAADAAPDRHRVKRSNYAPSHAAPEYGPSQCGASHYEYAPAPHAAAGWPYGYQHAAPTSYPSYMPHYRSEDFGDDVPDFQDHMAQMRAAYGGYGVPAAAVAGAPHYVNQRPAPGSYGQAMGVFSGANIGGCNVPLLVSCLPSITQGRILNSGAVHYGASAGAAPVSHPLPMQTIPAYRGVDPMAEIHSEEKHQGENHLDHDSTAAHDGSKPKNKQD